MKYLSSEEIAKKWGISDRSVRSYCFQGRVNEAYYDGKWYIPDNALKPDRKSRTKNRNLINVLKYQKNNKISGSIYNKLQIDFAYNSNHIEGTKLTHEETRYIFETKTISGDNILIDDIIETINHFRCFDYIIDTYDKTLNDRYIKQIHRFLKNNTLSSDSSEAIIGDYKRYENTIGDIETVHPDYVAEEMKELLNKYNKNKKHTFEDIVEFHKEFERIHPFFDGNGRVGRLIMFKECLKSKAVPFIIDDRFKREYYNGLKMWQLYDDKNYLIETCLLMQDNMKLILDYFEINYK